MIIEHRGVDFARDLVSRHETTERDHGLAEHRTHYVCDYPKVHDEHDSCALACKSSFAPELTTKATVHMLTESFESVAHHLPTERPSDPGAVGPRSGTSGRSG